MLNAAPKSSLLGPPLDLRTKRLVETSKERVPKEKRRKAFERMKEEPEGRIKDSECRHLSWEVSLHGAGAE